MARLPSEHYRKLKERHGELIAAVEALGKAAHGAGPLDEKTLHMIQLAAAAAIGSEGSTHSHTVRAMEAGATLEEVQHAILALTSTIGFPKMAAAMSWVDEVLKSF